MFELTKTDVWYLLLTVGVLATFIVGLRVFYPILMSSRKVDQRSTWSTVASIMLFGLMFTFGFAGAYMSLTGSPSPEAIFPVLLLCGFGFAAPIILGIVGIQWFTDKAPYWIKRIMNRNS